MHKIHRFIKKFEEIESSLVDSYKFIEFIKEAIESIIIRLSERYRGN